MASISLDSDATPDFVYEPLQPGEIRILQLAPGNKGDTLIGDLLTVDFENNAIEYDALSYMWGDPTPTDRIYLSDKALPLASNLTIALQHLRCASKPLIIWVDAICIDQQNYDERATQVQFMRILYRGASTVRIWIHEPGVDSDCAAMRALQSFPKDLKNDDSEVRKSMGDDPSFWDPLIPIFTNEYWKRAWVQQEVLNATQLSLHCMDIVIDGTSLAQFQESVMRRWTLAWNSGSLREKTWDEHLESMAFVQSPAARDILHHQGGSRLYDLCELLALQDLHITKPQDRVYALMHLAKNYEDGSLVVDYAKSRNEVMVEAAAYHVRVHRDLRFLDSTCLRAINNGHENEDEYLQKPTWLPQSWFGDRTYLERRLYYVPRTTKCHPDAIITANRRLQVRGLKVDRVKHCLIGNVSDHCITPRQFWNSLLGLYLQIFAGIGMRNLSDEAFRTLFGPSNNEIADFVERMTNVEANKSNIVQDYSWGQDEENDRHMLVAMKKAAISGLAVLLQLSQDPCYVDQAGFEFAGRLNAMFVDQIGPTAHVALRQLFFGSKFDSVIITETKKLGRIPICDFRSGDEIWVVLGIDEPLVLRPQPNGYYWHVCAAEIPWIQGHEHMRNLSSDIQPGEKIGEWVVKDIELE